MPRQVNISESCSHDKQLKKIFLAARIFHFPFSIQIQFKIDDHYVNIVGTSVVLEFTNELDDASFASESISELSELFLMNEKIKTRVFTPCIIFKAEEGKAFLINIPSRNIQPLDLDFDEDDDETADDIRDENRITYLDVGLNLARIFWLMEYHDTLVQYHLMMSHPAEQASNASNHHLETIKKMLDISILKQFHSQFESLCDHFDWLLGNDVPTNDEEDEEELIITACPYYEDFW